MHKLDINNYFDNYIDNICRFLLGYELGCQMFDASW